MNEIEKLVGYKSHKLDWKDAEIDRAKNINDRVSLLEDRLIELLKWKDSMDIEHEDV